MRVIMPIYSSSMLAFVQYGIFAIHISITRIKMSKSKATLCVPFQENISYSKLWHFALLLGLTQRVRLACGSDESIGQASICKLTNLRRFLRSFIELQMMILISEWNRISEAELKQLCVDLFHMDQSSKFIALALPNNAPALATAVLASVPGANIIIL